MKKLSVELEIERTLSRGLKRNVFIRKDFIGLGNYNQIGKALINLTRKAKLIRIGHGLYAKARINRITGSPMLAAEGGFDQVAKEALTRLGIKWQPSRAEQNYNAGLSTQVPVNTHVIIKSKFKPSIYIDKFKLSIQRDKH